MAHLHCVLDKEGYTRAYMHIPTRLAILIHTHTEILLFHCNNSYREHASLLRYTYIACHLSYVIFRRVQKREDFNYTAEDA